MTDYLALIGSLAVMMCAVVGAYVWLRWGWAGVTYIWGTRRQIDHEVEHDWFTRLAENPRLNTKDLDR